jgi:hypothetical protein
VADLARHYPDGLRQRLVLYHYESVAAAAELRALGYRVAEPGACFRLPDRDTLPTPLRRVV